MGGVKGTKLLSYVNEGYLDFAVNWLKYIRKLDMQSMSIVYCLDDASYERMSQEKDIEAKRWNSELFHVEATSELPIVALSSLLLVMVKVTSPPSLIAFAVSLFAPVTLYL